jgi:hypothetical protein
MCRVAECFGLALHHEAGCSLCITPGSMVAALMLSCCSVGASLHDARHNSMVFERSDHDGWAFGLLTA